MKTISLTMKETKAGAPYKLFQMEDGKRLSVFQFDSRYSEIVEGVDIPDDALVYDQQYDNYKLKSLPKPNAKSSFGGKAMEKVMETKNENIKEAQERRNDAVARAGAFRDATLTTIHLMRSEPFPTNDNFKREWEAWVKYYMGKADEPFV